MTAGSWPVILPAPVDGAKTPDPVRDLSLLLKIDEDKRGSSDTLFEE